VAENLAKRVIRKMAMGDPLTVGRKSSKCENHLGRVTYLDGGGNLGFAALQKCKCETCRPFWRDPLGTAAKDRDSYLWKIFRGAVDRNLNRSRMMSSLEGTAFGQLKSAGDFYSIFDNSVVTSEFFCQHKTVLSWGHFFSRRDGNLANQTQKF
jgi:hypothetical protein